MTLVRNLLGDVLRRFRQEQGRTLRQVSTEARVSLGYLSEVERGQKEASSELLAAICTALDIPLSELYGTLSHDLAQEEGLMATPLPEPTPIGAERDDRVVASAA